jgi:vesicle-associated membrane protein 7
MADDSFGRRTPFAFLQDIKEKFLSAYDRESALNAPIYGMNEFSKVIAKQMVCMQYGAIWGKNVIADCE